MIFFHGTNLYAYREIAVVGLRSPFLATNHELAWYYAEGAGLAADDDRPVVLEVHVPDTAKLSVDWKSIAEPVGYGKKTSKCIEERVAAMLMVAPSPTWRAAARITGAVLHACDIPACCIKLATRSSRIVLPMAPELTNLANAQYCGLPPYFDTSTLP